MTDAERRQRNWVELRAACTDQGTFDRIAEAIESDVEKFNSLSAHGRRNRMFRFDRTEQSAVYVGEVNESGDWIKDRPGINIQGSVKIRVWRNQQCQFAVEQEWNEETLTCDMKIDGECYSVRQISQKAIGNLMFGCD